VQQANAGQTGLRIIISGTKLRQDTQISVNGIVVVSHLQDTGNAGDPRISVELDENGAIKNSVGPLVVRARNTIPRESDLSNEVTAGMLIGPEITSIRVKKKGSGLLILKISGTNFPSDGSVVVRANGSQVPVQSATFEPPDFVSARISAASAPATGTTLLIRVVTPQGIQSNEATATSK
jgi:hypothetical protein